MFVVLWPSLGACVEVDARVCFRMGAKAFSAASVAAMILVAILVGYEILCLHGACNQTGLLLPGFMLFVVGSRCTSLRCNVEWVGDLARSSNGSSNSSNQTKSVNKNYASITELKRII